MFRTCTILFLFLLSTSTSGQDNFNVTPVGNALFSPSASDFDIQGDYAYCANIHGLAVWDISDPENMVRIAQCKTRGSAARLCINGDYAYVSDLGCGIAVIDISDPENPQVVNQVDVDIYQVNVSPPPDLVVNDGLLYICGGGTGYYIASIEDPALPEILYHYQYGQNFTHEFLFTEDAAYLLSRDLFTLDVEDPANVEIINTNDFGGDNMDHNENRLAIIGSRGIGFFSLEDPFNPDIVSLIEWEHSTSGADICVNADLAYISCFAGVPRFRIYDISDIAEPQLSLDIRWIIGQSLAYQNDVVYMASYRKGLLAISVEDPANPALMNEPLPEYTTTDIEIEDDLAYVWDQELDVLRIVDISNPAEPFIIGECDEMNDQHHSREVMTIYNDYLYLINRDGTTIVDISDPAEPAILGHTRYPEAPGNSNYVKTIDHYLYFPRTIVLDDRIYNLVVYDIADPLNPELAFFTNDFTVRRNNSARDHMFSGDFLYQLAYGDDEIVVYSLTNPAEPELVGRWEGDYHLFFIYNSIVYINRDGGFYLYNTENPAEPEEIGFFEFPYQYVDAYIEGEIAYLRCHGVGVICMSLEDPIHPEIVGYYDTPGKVEQIVVKNDHIYVADNLELGIYHLDYEIGDNSDFMIPMHAGWNLISSPFAPEERDIEAIFRGLAVRHNLFMVKDHNGRFYLPSQDFNNIPFWDVNRGYQVKLNVADDLWITGEEVEANHPIPLPQGWSLAAYFPEQAIETRTAFANIAEQLLFAKDGDGHFYTPEHNFNNIPPLHRGAGYQVKVSEEVELVWNVEGEGLASANFENLTLSHFIQVISTDKNMSIIITGLQDEGEIGAFTASGICVGATAFRNQDAVGLAVWGDDESTAEVDGLKEGEAFTLKLWSSSLGAEFDLEPENILTGYTGLSGLGLVYETDGFTFFAAKALPSIPDQYYLSQNYPNPFNSTTILPYGLPEASRLSIRIYDIAGRLVDTLVDKNIEAGYHTAIWDASTVSTGVYLVKMETESFSSVRKVILVR